MYLKLHFLTKFSNKGKLAPKVHWVIQDSSERWWSGIQISVTAKVFEDLSSFSRVDVEKVHLRFFFSHVFQSETVGLSEALAYENFPVAMVDRQVVNSAPRKSLWWKFCGVITQLKTIRAKTEEMMQVTYHCLFHSWFVPPLFIKFEDEFFYKEGRL